MNDPTHVVTNLVRLSYVHLFQPYQKQQQDKAKYSVTVLLPKSDVATKQRIDAAIAAATQRGITTCWQGLRPMIDPPIHDGDGVKPRNRTPYSPECKGHWVISASSNRRPEVVDANGNPILNESEVYSGCYGRVSLDFFPFANNGMGLACGLGNVQKLQEGEVLGGGTTAEQDFGATGAAGYAPQASTPQAYTPAQPAYAPAAPSYAPQAYAPTQPAYTSQAPMATPQAYAPAYAPAAPSYAQGQVNPITGLPM